MPDSNCNGYNNSTVLVDSEVCIRESERGRGCHGGGNIKEQRIQLCRYC